MFVHTADSKIHRPKVVTDWKIFLRDNHTCVYVVSLVFTIFHIKVWSDETQHTLLYIVCDEVLTHRGLQSSTWSGWRQRIEDIDSSWRVWAFHRNRKVQSFDREVHQPIYLNPPITPVCVCVLVKFKNRVHNRLPTILMRSVLAYEWNILHVRIYDNDSYLLLLLFLLCWSSGEYPDQWWQYTRFGTFNLPTCVSLWKGQRHSQKKIRSPADYKYLVINV